MTKIRRDVKNSYYMKTKYQNSKTGEPKTKYKRIYGYVVYMVQFPKGFEVSDLADMEVAFERRGDTITIRPKR